MNYLRIETKIAVNILKDW